MANDGKLPEAAARTEERETNIERQRMRKGEKKGSSGSRVIS